MNSYKTQHRLYRNKNIIRFMFLIFFPFVSHTLPCSEHFQDFSPDFSRNMAGLIKDAQNGDVLSQVVLGKIIKFTRVKGSEVEAFDWFEKAAKQGDAGAQYLVGKAYREGEGVEKNEGEAISWLEKAAEQDHADAQFELGSIYDVIGRGYDSYKKALYWLEKAAQQGHPYAQNNLAGIHRYGRGEGWSPNYEKALYWYEKAAEQGLELAQSNLSSLRRELSTGLQN